MEDDDDMVSRFDEEDDNIDDLEDDENPQRNRQKNQGFESDRDSSDPSLG